MSMKLKRILFLIALAALVVFFFALGFAIVAALVTVGGVIYLYRRLIRALFYRDNPDELSPESTEEPTETRVFEADYVILEDDKDKKD